MWRPSDTFAYTIADRRYFDTLERYVPTHDDYRAGVEALLPPEWRVQRNAVWFYCAPTMHKSAEQGWKIHLSSVPSCGREVLRAAVPILVAAATPFKFSVDRYLHSIINSKYWSRGGSGKFVTIYPNTRQTFMDLIEALHRATVEWHGPYILSDKRYKDSRVVFYRYGGFKSTIRVDSEGERGHFISGPDGSIHHDVRHPYVAMPPWITDPCDNVAATDDDGDADELTLNDGRYRIENVLTYKNSGGVYLARRTDDGVEVVIKEARPDVAYPTHETTLDSVDLLRSEYQVLQDLAHLRIAPRPLDLFQDWEHWYLVEERLSGITLQHFVARNNPLLRAEPSTEELLGYRRDFVKVFTELTRILISLKEEGLIFGDLSNNNIFVNPDTLEIKLIDLEGARKSTDKTGVTIRTPGFVSKRYGKSTIDDDAYALGANMFAFLFPFNGMFVIDDDAPRRCVSALARDLIVPADLQDLITTLLSPSSVHVPSFHDVLSTLSQPRDAMTGCHYAPSTERRRLQPDMIVADILASADNSRLDRLFPADPAVFRTNPLSLAYGACGTAVAISEICGKCPDEVLQWIRRQPIDDRLYPPGLAIGMSGIAWGLLRLGCVEKAIEVFELATSHPLLHATHSLFTGMAGYGVTSIRLWKELNEPKYLSEAYRAAEMLIQRAHRPDGGGLYWADDSNQVRLGLGHGAAGVALLFLHLFKATGEIKWLQRGSEALEFDLRQAVQTVDGGFSWQRAVNDPNRTVYPYWEYGSAGIGCVLVRYQMELGCDWNQEAFNRILIDTNRKYAIFPGLFNGLVGIGHFLLDAHVATGNPVLAARAARLAEGADLFAIDTVHGVATPGNGLVRLSCDFATGSAGVAHFIHRLDHGTRPFGFPLDYGAEGQGRSEDISDSQIASFQ